MAWWDTLFGTLDAAGGYNTAQGASAQLDAQKLALQQQQAQFQQMFGYNQQQTNAALGYAQDYGQQGAKSLTNYYKLAQGQYTRAGAALQNSNLNAISALRGGYNTSQEQMGGLAALGSKYGGQAATALQATSAGGPYNTLAGMRQSGPVYDVTGANAAISPYDVTQQRSGLAAMMGQGQQLGNQMNAQTNALAGRLTQGVDLQSDPGYQFRLQQGEQALNRSAAAQGGRLGGAQLKALADYNQGMASQEYGNAFNRQQTTNSQLMQLQGQGASQQLGLLGQQYGAASNVDQFGQAQQFNQAGRSDAAQQQYVQNQIALAQNQAGRSDAASQFNTQQYNSMLSDYANSYNTMGLNAAQRQDALNQQAQQNQYGLAQLGYGAQGQMAQMSGQYGQQLADLYGQYGSNMANMYGQQANMAQQTGGSLAQLYANLGSNMGNLATGSAGSNTSLSGQMMQAYQNFAQYPGMLQQAMANNQRQNLGTAAGLVASLYSDSRLKADLEPVASKYEAIGLQGYRWRWNEQAAALGLAGHDQGVIAQDVAKLYPEAVETGADGYLRVRYAALDALVARRG